ncbi:hypothetical protein MCC93_21020 [Morococcus cerebrosus]|uniref:Uncharacterized protein n=1 Tax=Morococcus cerebrosus TaxID=1056807 RepID=A0A0C1EC85_9NEIS|nr:hypothetical protein MCC93_21020 [Morococcus cerebrosus]
MFIRQIEKDERVWILNDFEGFFEIRQKGRLKTKIRFQTTFFISGFG